MKPIVFATAIAAIAVAFTLCYALPQSYQINVNFIPALVSGRCSIGQFWAPRNMTCTMCFCLTGRISRCVPQPGCSVNQNATTTTEVPVPAFPSSTMMPDANATTAASMSTTTTAASISTTTTARPPPPPNRVRHLKFGTAQLDEN